MDLSTSGEKIYINQARKPNKINGFWHLTNAYKWIMKGERVWKRTRKCTKEKGQ